MNKEKLKEKVRELSKLKENWDSYGANPFTQKIIDKVCEVIDCLDDSYGDPSIAPSSGGVHLEWESEEDALEIYVEEETDDIVYIKVIGEDTEDWKEDIISEINEINDLLKWLYYD